MVPDELKLGFGPPLAKVKKLGQPGRAFLRESCRYNGPP